MRSTGPRFCEELRPVRSRADDAPWILWLAPTGSLRNWALATWWCSTPPYSRPVMGAMRARSFWRRVFPGRVVSISTRSPITGLPCRTWCRARNTLRNRWRRSASRMTIGSCVTTSSACFRHRAPGGCCACSGTTRSPCSTAAGRSGARNSARWSRERRLKLRGPGFAVRCARACSGVWAMCATTSTRGANWCSMRAPPIDSTRAWRSRVPGCAAAIFPGRSICRLANC